LNFFSFRLESPIHAPKISVFGRFYPQSLGVHRSDPQEALTWAERRLLNPHWPRSDAQCDLWPWQRNLKREKTVANWLFAQTTHVRYRRQSLHAGWPPVCSSIFQVSLKSVQSFCRCGWSKIALSHYFGHWLIQQLVLPYKPWFILKFMVVVILKIHSSRFFTSSASSSSHYCSVNINIVLSCTVFELFDIESYRDLEIWVRSHSKSFKIVHSKAWVRFPGAFIATMALPCISSEIKPDIGSKSWFFSYPLCIRRSR